jgi:glycosyltransferase involved in cell wall biosynthesis
MSDAAIYFLPDGYTIEGKKLMGRQAAGNAYLRAAVRGREGNDVWACTTSNEFGNLFAKWVREIDDEANPRWFGPTNAKRLGEIGTLYYPSPEFAGTSNMRLRGGIDRYSICGVTHTTASHVAMDAISDILRFPVMPWDGLICTSTSVLKTVERLFEAEEDYLGWRFGIDSVQVRPQTPVIPLGVHCDRYDFPQARRKAARAKHNVGEDHLVALFVGRLAFHAKAHPHAMYLALQEAHRRTGRDITLVQAGWFATDGIERSFRDGAKECCPDINCVFIDGRDQSELDDSWAAADIFISLSDNFQETFGLTPIEAMAAGIPAVVTDWDGYRDTVRDGVDGFRIPTAMPEPLVGETFARTFEATTLSYDYYCGVTAALISIDHAMLVDRLTALIEDDDLRRRLGASGREHARSTLDWSVIFRRYQNFWDELATIRREDRHLFANSNDRKPPTVSPRRTNPFWLFDYYATRTIGGDTVFQLADGATADSYVRLSELGLYRFTNPHLPNREVFVAAIGQLENGEQSAVAIAEATGKPLRDVLTCVSVLRKMGLVDFAAAA